MRKIVNLAAAVLLLVATLREPAAASLHPWGNGSDPGSDNNGDHPWGGDGNKGGGDGGNVPGGSSVIGNPAVDIIYRLIIRPFVIGTQTETLITVVLPKANTSTLTQQSGTSTRTSNSEN